MKCTGGVGLFLLCLSCGLLPTTQAQNSVNVARDKQYNQINTDYSQGPSSNAANGDTSGTYSRSNCIRTNVVNAPWWEIDLGRTYPVYNIRLWAGTYYEYQLKTSQITVDDEFCTNISSFSENSRETEVHCASVMYGRKVRVTRLGNDQRLTLCEMEILVPSGVSECTVGMHGPSCSNRCSDYCGQGPGKNFCFKDSGYCYDGCVAGQYGNMCDRSCLSTRCLAHRCHQQTGLCTACATHFAGNNCQDCRPGSYGSNCDRQCRSSNCKDNRCDRSTGECLACAGNYKGVTCDECADGHYGVQCDEDCAECGTCDRDSGICTSCKHDTHLALPYCTECLDDYYRNPQWSKCFVCRGNCKAGTTCDKTTAHCVACPPGKRGHYCTDECHDGWFGAACNKTCGHCKEGDVCDKVTGHCPLCQPGSLPPLCKEECPDGKFGEGCKETCGHCQASSECRHDTGHCTGQCAEGFAGSFCAQAIKDDGDTLVTIVGVVLAAVVAIIITIVVCALTLRRRKRGVKSSSRSAEMASETAGMNIQDDTTPSASETAGMNIQDDTTPSASSSLPVVLFTAADEKAHAKPRVLVKPTVKHTTTERAGNSARHIYENVSLSAVDEVHKNGQMNAIKKGKVTKIRPAKSVNPSKEPLIDDEERDSLWSEEPVYSNQPTYIKSEPGNIRLENLQRTILERLQDGKVVEEFALMVALKDYPVTSGKRKENYYKNRFNSILPYDKNRVILEQVDNDDASDYINASFIDGYKYEKAYIASQGPRPNTQDDFWRMVWQEQVTDIVMLTNLTEGNKTKCHGYWPDKGNSLNTGHMVITGVDEEERAQFVIRTFQVGELQSKHKREVKQYHYTKWMDHEVPTTTPLIDFWRYVRMCAPRAALAPPLLVHCSAGVGRTGTYIALDIILDQAQEEMEISIYKTVDNLRDYRCHMVQNKGQYQFLYEAVLEAVMSGDSRLESSAMDHIFPTAINHSQANARIDAEFERLCKMRTCLNQPFHGVASLEENIDKNRDPDSLPDDKDLVYITEHMKGRNQYINAVYMPTFLCARGSMVTQLPLADTVVDLWRLVDSWNVSTIVCIGQEEGQKEINGYWPKTNGEPINTGVYTITLKSMDSLGDSLSSYTMDLTKQNKSRMVRVLHYEAWTEEVADNISDLICLLDTLHASYQLSSQQPVIIQCIDGVSRSGIVCALSNVISRMTYDGHIDVYLAVRHVHTVRFQAVSSIEQYRFIYEVVQQYRDSHNVYVNT